MIKKYVNTIQADSNLEVSRDCGQKGGHVAENLGMKVDVVSVFIEDTQRMHRLDSV